MTMRMILTIAALLCLCSPLLPGLTAQAQARRHETTVGQEVHTPQTTTVRSFVRTDTQQEYYVDSRGGLHQVTRQVTQPTGLSGILYYIEDDDRPYSLDENRRLYTRDQSGRIYYLEDVRQGRTIESRVIVQNPIPYRDMTPTYSQESCAHQYEKCLYGCQGLSRREAYTRPTCINNCEIIRNGCNGR
ncbi:MAG: hypothetical protein B193_3464 [Solidesulfovibrio magneticus str. Maddingley MBC34]|uniref:Uncharacterized protein n=1 Tax=Solidesulfovibrio magneticus str. Maddingley MBC34 TaxID=1206767 RepID=K6H5T2_9BACT|nr:MAG: hypothetical protein B193_3464 [Solidesulfovibrio magneticus str. Maddingley MBC34]